MRYVSGMSYVIGVDEAGYGPNLGPLVVTATVWRLPADCRPQDLPDRVSSFISAPGEAPVAPLVIGDSKALYKAGGSLGPLERVVLGAALSQGWPCGTWRRLWESLALADRHVANACDFRQAFDLQPWYAQFDRALPVEGDLVDVVAAASAWHAMLETTGVELVALTSLVVFPNTWNRLLQETDGKGEALSRLSLDLVQHCLQTHAPSGSVAVCCDKHGGRNKYGRLLQQTLPENLIEVYKEQRDESVYRTSRDTDRLEFRFTAKGDRSAPSGLASMVSKYLRELAMQPFNEYWRQHLPDLKPTAGYPEDAKRFCREIREVQRQLGIGDDLLWRNR